MPRPPPRATPEVADKGGSPEMTPSKPTCVRTRLRWGEAQGRRGQVESAVCGCSRKRTEPRPERADPCSACTHRITRHCSLVIGGVHLPAGQWRHVGRQVCR